MRRAAAVGVGVLGLILLTWGSTQISGDGPRGLDAYAPLFLSALALAAAAVLLLGREDAALALVGRTRAFGRIPRLRVLHDEWAEAAPARPVREAAELWSAIAAPAVMIIPAAALHYLVSDGTVRGPVGVVAVLALTAAALAAAAAAVRYVMPAWRAADARVLVFPARIVLGRELSVRVQQEFLTTAHVEVARVGIVCVRLGERGGEGRDRPAAARTVFERWKEAAIERDAKKGRKLRMEESIHLPSDGNPTTPAGFGGSPGYEWQVRVVVRTSHGPPYQGEFPIPVLPAAAATDDLAVTASSERGETQGRR